MRSIPEEIVYHFFDPTILSQSDLCSTALVCRAWRSASQIRLWQFPVTLHLLKHGQSLLDHNELGSQITKDVTLVLAENDEEAAEVYRKGFWRAKVEAVVHRLKGVEKLRLVGLPYLDVAMLQRFPGMKHLDLGRATLFNGSPRWPFIPRFTLQSLSFGVPAIPAFHDIYIPLVQHSSALTHLSVDWTENHTSADVVSAMTTFFPLIAPTVTDLSLPSRYNLSRAYSALANLTALQTLTIRLDQFPAYIDFGNVLPRVLNAMSRIPHLIIDTFSKPLRRESCSPAGVTDFNRLFDYLFTFLRNYSPVKRVEALTVVLRARLDPQGKGYYKNVGDAGDSRDMTQMVEEVREASSAFKSRIKGIVDKYELVFRDDPTNAVTLAWPTNGVTRAWSW